MNEDHLRGTVIAVVGTNASGKSDLGVHLAVTFSGEVISADSRQVFRGLDLGTGKLPMSERAGIPHHLLDVVDVGDPFSLAHYQRTAYRVISDALTRRRLPVIVGGSPLYVRAVVDGYELVDVPPDPALRTELAAADPQDVWETLHRLDATAATQLDPRNRRRVMRAIEVARSGLSYGITRRANARYNTLQLGLTWPHDVLCARIEKRLQRRIELGLVDEVAGLLARGARPHVIDALGLEYRHVLRLLTGVYRDDQEMFRKLTIAIQQFSRRQMGWFKKDQRIVWLNAAGDYRQEAVDRVAVFVR